MKSTAITLPLKEQLRIELKHNLPPSARPPWDRFLYWLLSLALFSAISYVAVFFALGYRVNWHSLTVVRTGLIKIDSQVTGRNTKVYLNDELLADKIPVNLNGIFPGIYQLRIEKPGYQKYELQVVVQSNQRVLFNNILLIRESPLPLATEDIGYYDSRFLERRGENIEIRSGNEIWAKGSFITRTSVDIGSLQWFPDGKHLVVQIGDEIRLLDLDGKHSQLIIKLNTVQPVAYFFQDSGREFYYIDSGQVKGLELFEPRSLVERISYTQ